MLALVGCDVPDPAAVQFNRRLVDASNRLMEAARPFGQSLAPALTGQVDPTEVQSAYRQMADVVQAINLETESMAVPELAGARELFAAFRAFVVREQQLVDGPWAEIVRLVGDQRELPTETVVRIHSIIEEQATEEDRLLAEVHRLEEEFLEKNGG